MSFKETWDKRLEDDKSVDIKKLTGDDKNRAWNLYKKNGSKIDQTHLNLYQKDAEICRAEKMVANDSLKNSVKIQTILQDL